LIDLKPCLSSGKGQNSIKFRLPFCRKVYRPNSGSGLQAGWRPL
jgi:hypothetical protein